MEFLSHYIYVLAPAAGYISAQVAKYIISGVKQRALPSYRELYRSGRMPSSHSAMVVALVTVVGLRDGIQSGLFGLALAFATVVVYDAMMVRRSSGEQGESLTALIKEQKSKVRLPRVARGHTPLEVAVGALLGAVMGVLAVLVAGGGSL